jgi:hypothetical protein
MSESEQRDQIERCRNAAHNLVANAVKIIASEGRKAIVGNLLQVTRKDTIKAVCEFAKTDEMRHELFDAQGSIVLLVVADAEPFKGERAPAEAIPDQSDLLRNAEDLKKSDGKVQAIRTVEFED